MKKILILAVLLLFGAQVYSQDADVLTEDQKIDLVAKVAVELMKETKEIDYHKPEHRFAILKALVAKDFPGVTVQPIPPDRVAEAAMVCLKMGIKRGAPGIEPSAGIVNGQLVCLATVDELAEDNKQGWREMCELFHMEFISNPTEHSVLCGPIKSIEKF